MKYTLLILTTLFALMAFCQESDYGDFKWRLTQVRQIDGKTYSTYTNDAGDQVVLKPRTKKSENPEEDPTGQNLPNRQAIFEFGVGFGMTSTSPKFLQYTKDGVTGEYGQIAGKGMPTRYSKQPHFDFNAGIHPPVSILKGLTLGVNVTPYFTFEPDSKSVNEFEVLPDGKQGKFVRALGEHKAGYDFAINFIATQDFWYIPGKESTHVFSAGAYYGYKTTQFMASPNSAERDTTFRPDKGVVIKYKFLAGDGTKAVSNFYVQSLISVKGGYQVAIGMDGMVGRRNAPKKRTEK